MNKLHNGKKWMTVDDAATYISSALEEPVSNADIFQSAMEDSLTLSVHIIDREYAVIGDIIDELVDEVDLNKPPHSMLHGFWKERRSGSISGICDIVNVEGGKKLLEMKHYFLRGNYDKPQATNGHIYIRNTFGSVCRLHCLVDYQGDELSIPATSFPDSFQFVLLKDRVDELINHLHNQKQPQYKSNPLSEREKNSHLNVISALLHVVLGKDGVAPHPDFDSEAQLINHITQTYSDCGEGLAKSTLEKRFSEAKKALP